MEWNLLVTSKLQSDEGKTMNANEMIHCELREDGLQQVTYKHMVDISEVRVGCDGFNLHGWMAAIGMTVLSLAAMAFDSDMVEDGVRIIRDPWAKPYETSIFENELILPDKIGGIDVVEIATNAFYGLYCNRYSYRTSVTNFYLPRNLKRIDAQAFGNILGLSEIRFPKTTAG